MAKKIIKTTCNAAVNEVTEKPERKRAAAYCRVSTLAEEQAQSYEFQKEYYETYIQKHPDWELVGIYGDHGCSGLRISERPDFRRMVQDCMDGKIDVIIVKSVSRVARNAYECQEVLEQIHAKGVYIYFEKEGIVSSDPQFSLILKLLQGVAQEESNSQSQAIKWSVNKNAAMGRPAFKCCFGYHKTIGPNGEKHQWAITEEEATMVRRAFDMAEAGASTTEIAKAMTAMESERGSTYQWLSSRVVPMLKNIAYKGDILTHKTVVKDYLTGKAVKNDGFHEQYYLEGHHPAIISAAQFDKVQSLLEARSPGRRGRKKKDEN